VDIYAYAWTSDPIVKGLIMQSGVVATTSAMNTSVATDMFLNVSSTVGCGPASSDAASILSCMQSVNSSSILNALGPLAFTPASDNITVFTQSDYAARNLAGNFSKLPILVGNTDNEAPLFAVAAILSGSDPSQYQGPAVEAYNQKFFSCPSAMRANISVFNHVPTWRYRWFGVFPNTNLTTYPDSGAYHGSEIALIFGTAPVGPGIPPSTQKEREFMNYARGAWAAFVKDPLNGLKSYGWPMYDPAGDTLVRLGYNESIGANAASSGLYDGTCENLFSATQVAGSGATTSGVSSFKSWSTMYMFSVFAGIVALTWIF
jgi:cholinesterase